MTDDTLRITYISIDDLKPYENNPRVNDNTVPFLQNSFRNAGFIVPIVVDANYTIVAGHTRIKAITPMIDSGEEVVFVKGRTVPCVFAEYLSEEQIARFRLEDNRVSDFSEWNWDMLIPELESLKAMDIDPADMGFNLPELEDFDFDDDEEDEEEAQEYAEDDFETEMDELYLESGDVVQMGSHRLMCGDSTSDKDMQKLMGDRRADITFTSPPYNAGTINRNTLAREGNKYINDVDDAPEEDYDEFIAKNLTLLLKHSHEVLYNMGVVAGSKHTIIRTLNRFVDKFKDFVYWQKTNPVPGINDNVISSSTELIMAFGENSSRGFRNHFGIWYGIVTGPTVTANDYKEVHRATFPLYLPTEIVKTFTSEGQLVLDSFMGTGTTLIACEDTGRIAYGMEIEPLYCQIAVERWINHVGSDENVVVYRGKKAIPYSKLKKS